jgi:hypothetical protein
MSLRLRQAIPGRPNSSPHSIDTLSYHGKAWVVRCQDNIYQVATRHGPNTLQVYSSGPNVVLLDSQLQLTDTLQFWSALPYRAASSSTSKVDGVCCSSADGLVSVSRSHLWRSIPNGSRFLLGADLMSPFGIMFLQRKASGGLYTLPW